MALKRTGSAARICEGATLGPASKKRKPLRIVIPCVDVIKPPSPGSDVDPFSALSSGSSSLDSLFDETESTNGADEDIFPASLTAPSTIGGLYFDPTVLLPEICATSVWEFCQETYFRSPGVNQVMLFGRFNPESEDDAHISSSIGFPPVLVSLLDTLSVVLRPTLPKETYDLLFPETPTQARQAIINLYHPGEGITPHVDLLGRYADGIIGVSFGSGSVMRFDQVTEEVESHVHSGPEKAGRHDLYLPQRSVVVLSKDARYKWTHGIDKRTRDYVVHGSSAGEEDKVRFKYKAGLRKQYESDEMTWQLV
ncbi:hypothetical protein CC1G_10657 [Coprinopsis cinerea okayama7|uniref:Fe2OG dioxygenase domain-containing protein n=1 Tax=Coprinopsis cinerea (strain Okayama-7 / 130 / ATCC MYA-4618 / FGSC 9003) TaxID=240176 RepID=A8P663_COPC7|nr:hypothetical protein CC1G_10657 [Coprinopsis cinerea okayama7\|eukprot:XP_001839092.2 hypothetical protein CC1G_10657 [Coprinopsis cinerea okayama7\